MRVLVAAAVLLMVATARNLLQPPMNALLLERDIVSLADIPLPKLLRLAKLSATMDLEEEVGGGAMKPTAFEKDMTQAVFLEALKAKLGEDTGNHEIAFALANNKPRNLLDLEATGDVIAKQTENRHLYNDVFTKELRARDRSCLNCFDSADQLKSIQNFLNAFPPLLSMGEAVDQYFDLVKGCPFAETEKGQLERASKGLSPTNLAESAAARFPVSSQEGIIPALQTSFEELNFDWVPGDSADAAVVSVCEFVRPYLEERGFIDSVMWGQAKGKWPKDKASMDFADFKSTGWYETDSEYNLAFKAADLSSYFELEGPATAPLPPTGSLDSCEFQLAYASRFGGRKWVGEEESLFFKQAPAKQAKFKSAPSFLFQSKKDSDPVMMFRDFERVTKTIDMGNFAAVGEVYDMNRLVGQSSTIVSEDPSSLDQLLFDSISEGSKSGEINTDHLKGFFKRFCRDSTLDTKIDKESAEAMRDYDRDASGSWDFQDFKTALTRMPLPVQGVPADAILSACRAEGLEPTSLKQNQFIGVLAALVRFGTLARFEDLEDSDVQKSTISSRIAKELQLEEAADSNALDFPAYLKKVCTVNPWWKTAFLASADSALLESSEDRESS